MAQPVTRGNTFPGRPTGAEEKIPKKLSILLLNYEFPPIGGGSSPVTYEIGKRYVDRGHDVDVVTMAFADLPPTEEIDGMQIFRVPCRRRDVKITQIHELASYAISARRFLRARLQKKHYDVNHAHFLVPTGLVARSIKRSFGLPYIVSAHGSDIPGYNPDRFRFAHQFTGPILRRIVADAESIVVMSNYLAGLIRKNVNDVSEDKLLHIRNGIDWSGFRPQQKKKIILSTGRLLPRKGFQYLIDALSEENCGYEIHICGDGPMLKVLRAAAETSKTKIFFHGWVDNQSDWYRDLLGSAAVYVLVSERENSSIALLEAMSAGCAIITSDSTGCRETVADAGLLVQPASSKKLRQSILSLINDDQLRHKLQQRAVNRARTIYDWDKIIDLYEQALFQASNSASDTRGLRT